MPSLMPRASLADPPYMMGSDFPRAATIDDLVLPQPGIYIGRNLSLLAGFDVECVILALRLSSYLSGKILNLANSLALNSAAWSRLSCQTRTTVTS